MYVRLAAHLRGRVGGLCGNFDGDAENDFTTRQGIMESTAELFGNSWKVSPSCPDVADQDLRDPCVVSSTPNTLTQMFKPPGPALEHCLKRVSLCCPAECPPGDLGEEKVCHPHPGALLSMSFGGALPAVLRLVCLRCLWVSVRTDLIIII